MVTETTALGAAYLAGLHAGIFQSTADIGKRWQRDRRFEPDMNADQRDSLYAGWQQAVARVRSAAPTTSSLCTSGRHDPRTCGSGACTPTSNDLATPMEGIPVSTPR